VPYITDKDVASLLGLSTTESQKARFVYQYALGTEDANLLM